MSTLSAVHQGTFPDPLPFTIPNATNLAWPSESCVHLSLELMAFKLISTNKMLHEERPVDGDRVSPTVVRYTPAPHLYFQAAPPGLSSPHLHHQSCHHHHPDSPVPSSLLQATVTGRPPSQAAGAPDAGEVLPPRAQRRHSGAVGSRRGPASLSPRPGCSRRRRLFLLRLAPPPFPPERLPPGLRGSHCVPGPGRSAARPAGRVPAAGLAVRPAPGFPGPGHASPSYGASSGFLRSARTARAHPLGVGEWSGPAAIAVRGPREDQAPSAAASAACSAAVPLPHTPAAACSPSAISPFSLHSLAQPGDLSVLRPRSFLSAPLSPSSIFNLRKFLFFFYFLVPYFPPPPS